jgi:hypothetical protein
MGRMREFQTVHEQNEVQAVLVKRQSVGTAPQVNAVARDTHTNLMFDSTSG